MVDKKKVTDNLLWRFFERIGAQGVTFLVSIVLARLLEPEVYGTIALVTVFTTIMQVFVDSGMGNALIQKKKADDLDFSSVFFFNITMCSILYLIMFLLSPAIANFYRRPDLTLVIRIISLTLIISGIKNIQQAYVSRNLLFKKFFFATLSGTIGAAVVGIWMAYKGYGIWALVVQHLFNSTVDTIILWITVNWRPKKIFSLSRLRELYSYGWKMLVSSLLDTAYSNLRALVIGKKYSSEDLAFYNRGDDFPRFIVGNINASIDSVLLPTMSIEQDNRVRIKTMARRAIKTSTYLILPLMVGLAVCAESAVKLILTDKWLPCVFFLRVFCFAYALYPVHTANLNVIKAMGRSDLFLKLEIIKKCCGFAVLIATMFISVEAIALGIVFTSVLGQIINSWPNQKLLGYSYYDQILDMFPQIALSCFMGLIVYTINFLKYDSLIKLLIQIPLGAVVYIIGSKLLHIDSYDYVKEIIKEYLKKGREELF